jgi:hypothetical protein
MSNQHRGLGAVAVLVAMTTWGPSLTRSFTVATAAPKLTDLRGVDDLRTIFNQDQGKIRLVLLVSPT